MRSWPRVPAGLAALGDRQIEQAARGLAYRIDPHAALTRTARAHTDRRVSLRPAPDTMSVLSGLLPCAQGVAAYAALCAVADSLRAAGDPRSRGQVMSDTLVERLTGQATAQAVPVEVQLVLTDHTLLGDHTDPGRQETAHLHRYGPIPAGLARDLLTGSPEHSGGKGISSARVWLRRLYTHPSDGSLVALDSRRRCFDDGLRRLLVIRDQYCRTPWCGAPIRHVDHARPHSEGGTTSSRNGQGLCEACNHTKQVPGWSAHQDRDGTVVTTAPTGHSYTSHPPPLPGSWPPRPEPAQPVRPEPPQRLDTFSPYEQRLHLLIGAA